MKTTTNLKHRAVTDKILFAFYKQVFPTLGSGFLEKVYENALAYELRKVGLQVVQQPKIAVYYDNVIVGEYFPDLVVEDKVIIELKAVAELSRVHEAQLLNYLKATPHEVGLLLNFGAKPTHKRRAYDNSRKYPRLSA